MSDFYSLYSHDFVRIALLRAAHPGGRCALQPRRDAAAGGRGRQGRRRADGLSRSSGSRPTPSRTCCCRTRCSTRSSARSPRSSRRRSKLNPVLIVGRAAPGPRPALQQRRRHPSRRHPGRGAQDLPAELPRVLREAPFRLGRQRARAGNQARRPDRAVRHRPAVPLDRQRADHLPCRDLRGHLGAGAAVEPRRPRRRRSAGEPLGQQHHHRQGRDAPPAVRQPVGARQSRPMPIRRRARASRRPTSPGTATRRSTSAATSWPSPQRFAKDSVDHPGRRRSRPHPPGAAAQQRLRRLRGADEGTRVHALPHRRRSSSTRRRSAWRCSAPIERFPYVPSDPAKLRDNCYEAYNIQVQGLAQRLQSSRVGKRASSASRAASNSTQALLVACRAMDLLGLDRKNVLAFTMPGFGTSDKTHKNAWRLMKCARRHGGRDRHQAVGRRRC